MAEKFPTSLRKNGLEMVTFKMDVDLTVKDIATHVASQLDGEFDHLNEDQFDEFLAKRIKSRQAAIQLCRDSFWLDGCEVPGYRIGDSADLTIFYPYVERRIQELWS